MGKQKKEIRSSFLIQAKELFSNQICPMCGTYLALDKMELQGRNVILFVSCLNDECNYEGERELI